LRLRYTGEIPRRFSVSPAPKPDSREPDALVFLAMKNIIWKLRSLRDTHGQDLIEYALMAGFVAVAAGAVIPNVADSISTIFSKVTSALNVAATQGS
jgi:pilus assembly protein Flp/PilA